MRLANTIRKNFGLYSLRRFDKILNLAVSPRAFYSTANTHNDYSIQSCTIPT